jgi:hypothetical protein
MFGFRRSLCVLTFFLFILFISVSNAAPQENDISLAKSFPQEKLQEILIPLNEYHPFPKASDREAWERIPQAIQHVIIQKAEELAELEVPILPASVYLQYKRNGNRSNYQNIWYERRERLHVLVAAECIENKGRFLDPITDLIWAICEETSWTWPAHIHPQEAGTDLPDADDQVVALFSAQTSNSLVLTNYLLGEQLDTISPLISERIDREIERRILTPILTKEFGWMGYSARRNKHYPNNWNPWICSNVLISALLSEKNEIRRVRLVHKVLDCLDNFLTYYPQDGSCDEGPSYWGRAGASLFDALEHLYSATNKQFDYYQHPLIQEIARFIYRAHIVDDYFVCIGDCDARINIPNELVYRFGKRTGDEHLKELGAYGIGEGKLLDSVKRNSDLNRFLHLLLNGQELVEYNPPSQPMLQDVWLGHPNMQMMAARDQEGSAEGLFLAVWGGHNAQSHNHNDVGNFIIFTDGKPVVIDIGRPTYRRQTFSSRRYEIWAFQSGFHNLPTINGVDQKAGRQYAAKNVSYHKNDSRAYIEMDIADAYPEEAGAESWNRIVRLNRGKDVVIADSYTLRKPSKNIIENFIIAGKVTDTGRGRMILNSREEEIQMLLEYDSSKLSSEIEPIQLKDSKLRQVWGDYLYRIRLKTKSESKKDQLEFRFSKMK